MTNVVFSPALQAPITLTPTSVTLSVAGGSAVIAGQASLVPHDAALALVAAPVTMRWGMGTAVGTVSLAAVAPGVIRGTVTPRTPVVGSAAFAGQSPTVTQASGGGGGNPAWITVPTQNLTVGLPQAIYLGNYNPTAVYFYVDPTTLPTGMTLDPLTGIISGTPTGAGASSFTALAFDTVGEGDFYLRSHYKNASGQLLPVAVYGLDDNNQVFNGYTDPPTGAKYYPSGTGATRAALDANTPGGYGSSLRFDVPANVADSNQISGQFTSMQSPWAFNGNRFSQHSRFAVQFRLFFTSNWITNWLNFWNLSATGFKIINLHMGNQTATSIEITVGSVYGWGLEINTQGGDVHFVTDLTDPELRYPFPQDADRTQQSGWDLTSGPNWKNEPNALVSNYGGPYNQWPVNEWLTVVLLVNIGGLYSDYQASNPQDGTLEAWLQRAGMPVTNVTTGPNCIITVNSQSTTNPFAVGQPITPAATVGFNGLNGKTGTVTAVGGVKGAWTATTTLTANGVYESGGVVTFLQKFCSVQVGFSYNGGTSDGYDGFYLSPYMTGLSTAAPTTASMFIDEVIISTDRVPPPIGP